MDSEIKELRAMMEKTLALTADTNAIVHSMRNSARVHTFIKLIYWAIIIGSIYLAYVYLTPVVETLLKALGQMQTDSGQLQSTISKLQGQVSHILPGAK